MDWKFRIQLFPTSNTLIGLNYQSGSWVDYEKKIEQEFGEISLGLLIIVFHFEWS